MTNEIKLILMIAELQYYNQGFYDLTEEVGDVE